MTYRIICTNPETKEFTVPEKGIATRDEAHRVADRYRQAEHPVRGVLLAFTVEEED